MVSLIDRKRKKGVLLLFFRKKSKDELLQHSSYIYRVAYRYAGNRMDAEDLTQETFYNAYKKFDQLKDKSKSKSWLFAILRNIYIRELEKKHRYKIIDLENYVERLPAEGVDIELEIDLSSSMLQKALNVLEEKYKSPLLLFYFDEISYKEIAAVLDIPIGTVMSRIARAKRFLRSYLDEMEEKRVDNVINIKEGAL